ncbi:hypothetical protein BH20ACT18_BH20ACT18_12930 [soil metagenome]
MPTWLVIVLLVIVGLVVALALAGGVAVARRRREQAPAFEGQLVEANRALAAAHAQDKGWDAGALRQAARRAFEAERPGDTVRDMQLVQVVDPPGIERDRAVFRFETEEGGAHELTLGRAADGWRLERSD